MKKFYFVFAFSLLFNIFAVDLIKGGHANGFIHLERNAPAPVRLAADEISHYAEKITGTPLTIGEESDKSGNYVISFRIETDPALGIEGYRISGNEKSLLITGGCARAVLYGAYAFIEEFFGVRWFAPGDLYEHVPSQKSLTLPDTISRIAKPEFTVRRAGFVSSNWNSDLSETWKFLARNRWQVKGNFRLSKKFSDIYNGIDVCFSGGGHCLSSLISDRLFDTHPEYFALVNGKRIRQMDEKGKALSQPCTTHPEVIALAVKGITEFFNNAPSGTTYLIGNNDIMTWCECDRCTALDPPEEKKKGYVSTRFYTFINTVAAEVRKKHPNAKILGWGYQNYRFAPAGIKPDPLLRINLCDHQRCYRHSLLNTSCEQNDIIRKMFLSWRAYGLPVTERGYQESLLRYGYFYLPIEHIVADDLRYFKTIGVDGYEFITTAPDGTYRKSIPPEKAEALKNAMYCLWPAIYICGKMFWNTSLEPGKIWEEAGSRFYGNAWPVMKKYRKLLREAYTETSGHIIYCNSPVDLGRSLQKPGIEKKLCALLNQAENLAADNPDKKVAERLKLEKKYFTETWIRNARLFEKTQNRSSAGKRTSEPIIIDGKMNEKSWKNTEFITGYPGNTAPPANPADIFAKLLFDEEYIYLAISGTAPVENEKWIITFPDHKRLAVPLKQFDLDKITPFAKEKKKNRAEICYELKIPRSLIGLNKNSAGLHLNIKRNQFSQVSAALYKTPLGCITLGKEGVKNSSFSDLKQKADKGNHNITVPKFWSGAGKGYTFENGHIRIHGTMYQFLQVSGGRNGGVLNIDILCSSTGKSAFIQPYLSLCIREPGNRKKFQHENKKYGKKDAVTSKGIRHFMFELAPYEKGYLYLKGRNTVIESITAAFTENRAE